jgi:uncharacterized repeat protein (TIGR02543 family)
VDYAAGEVVTLTAYAVFGWSFAGWSGDLTGTENPATVTMDADMEVTATFVPTEYTLTINLQGAGVVLRVPAQETYHYGDVVRLTALPNQGWSFAGWSGDATGSVNPRTVIVTGNMEITATFVQDEYSLQVDVVGDGTVERSPDQLVYHYGDQIRLLAIAAPGWTFRQWGGDLAGVENPVTVTVTSDLAITATFDESGHTLTVLVVGQGMVRRNPDQDTYRLGDEVILTAVPAPGWAFAGWSGDLTGIANPRVLTVTRDHEVTATFSAIEYRLEIQTSGSGQVSRSPAQATYRYGDQVTLMATAAVGWSFLGWGGDASGSENPKKITITRDTSVTAAFGQDAYTLVIQVVGAGSVQRDPLRATYRYGDRVKLSASTGEGWHFVGWTGDASGTENPKTITMTGNTRITATFAQDEFMVHVAMEGRGKVWRDPEKAVYHLGDRVTLTAWAPLGWHFQSWGGDLVGSQNPGTLVVMDDHKVTATFAPAGPGEKHRAYLPSLLEAWPPLPYRPAMLGISNGDGDGDYLVRWSNSLWADTYTLQEATRPGFVGAETLYSGPLIAFQVTGQGAGRYYYRARAHNAWGTSGWSNVVLVDVRWEREPNEQALTQANGPVVSGLIYYGTFPNPADKVDYFYFDLAERRSVELSLTNIPAGHNYDLSLENASLREVASSDGAGDGEEHIRTDRLAPGRYYVRVANTGLSGSAQVYHLRVVY